MERDKNIPKHIADVIHYLDKYGVNSYISEWSYTPMNIKNEAILNLKLVSGKYVTEHFNMKDDADIFFKGLADKVDSSLLAERPTGITMEDIIQKRISIKKKAGRPKGKKNSSVKKASLSLSADKVIIDKMRELSEVKCFNMSQMFSDCLTFVSKEIEEKETFDLKKSLKAYKKQLITNRGKSSWKPDSKSIMKNKSIVNMTLDTELAKILREDEIFRDYNVSGLVNNILWKIYRNEVKQ